ncbi:riboflavin-binding protein-like [Dendropsophus ebraccatus]|uniref:riboflavin-binding protein-like n=1 Tax=Dendropsophus ebraccatus TaxID=150705 RepID=UPI003831D0E8
MSPLFLCLLSSFLIFSQSTGSPDTCAVKKRQKLTAGPEPGLTRCQQYSSHSCCAQEHLDTASSIPFPWTGCRSLSPRCEEYVSRVQCMYLCSPHISKWGLPGSVAGIHELPLCDTFCGEWFDACKQDLICSETTDLKTNCSKGCITYKQKFGSGENMCDTIWKHSFVAMTEQCFCITPPQEGADATQLDSAHAELDRTQEGSSGYSEICFQDPHSIPKRVRRALRKRSIQLDVDGSGSGNGV